MSTVVRRNRKGSDAEILRLNSVGLSLITMGRLLGCHPSSLSQRLKALDVDPVDTRRSFMEDVFVSLPEEYQEKLADLLLAEGPEPDRPKPIKDYVRELLVRDVAAKTGAFSPTQGAQPAHV